LINYLNNVNIQDKNGNTPLMRLVQMEYDEYLIIYNKSIAGVSDAITIIDNRKKFIKQLLDRGANPTIKNNEGICPFRWVFPNEKDSKIIDDIIQATGKYVKLTFNQFLDGIANNDIPIVTLYIINNKDKVNQKDENGNTSLIYAVSRKYSDIVKILLDNGADPNIPDYKGILPLKYAIEYRDSESGKHLINACARCSS
jgi:ankyrin repeat protein